MAPEHLQGLLEVAAKEAGDKQEGGYSSAVLDLLLGCAASAPALFAGMSKQVSNLEYPSKVQSCTTQFAGISKHVSTNDYPSKTKIHTPQYVPHTCKHLYPSVKICA